MQNWIGKEFSCTIAVSDITGDNTLKDLSVSIYNSLNVNSLSLSENSHDHYVCYRAWPNAKQLLVCFPYFGGTINCYERCQRNLIFSIYAYCNVD